LPVVVVLRYGWLRLRCYVVTFTVVTYAFTRCTRLRLLLVVVHVYGCCPGYVVAVTFTLHGCCTPHVLRGCWLVTHTRLRLPRLRLVCWLVGLRLDSRLRLRLRCCTVTFCTLPVTVTVTVGCCRLRLRYTRLLRLYPLPVCVVVGWLRLFVPVCVVAFDLLHFALRLRLVTDVVVVVTRLRCVGYVYLRLLRLRIYVVTVAFVTGCLRYVVVCTVYVYVPGCLRLHLPVAVATFRLLRLVTLLLVGLPRFVVVAFVTLRLRCVALRFDCGCCFWLRLPTVVGLRLLPCPFPARCYVAAVVYPTRLHVYVGLCGWLRYRCVTCLRCRLRLRTFTTFVDPRCPHVCRLYVWLITVVGYVTLLRYGLHVYVYVCGYLVALPGWLRLLWITLFVDCRYVGYVVGYVVCVGLRVCWLFVLRLRSPRFTLVGRLFYIPHVVVVTLLYVVARLVVTFDLRLLRPLFVYVVVTFVDLLICYAFRTFYVTFHGYGCCTVVRLLLLR